MTDLSAVKVYTEIGIGNLSFVNSEIEFQDGQEIRQPGFVRMRVTGVYSRFWLGTRVFIFSTKDGFKSLKKESRDFKILFGIEGLSNVKEENNSDGFI